MNCFENYTFGIFDEMFDKNNSIKDHWKILANNLQNINIDGLSQKQYEIDWQLQENGVTYNIYSEKQLKRKWNLDPIPFILETKEWEQLKYGIIQRMKLLDTVFKDIYGEQKLLKSGILPPEVLYVDPHFIREVKNFKEEYFNLNLYAIDISRGPDGKFWVISDKTDSPSGLGYAIENRITMNSVNGDLIKNIQINRISEFIEGFKERLTKYKLHKDANIVMLSPGPYNETFFEQSYLSSILGCELVRGEDLIVKDGYLYLKNLSGLKQIDIVIRRVDDRFCDPLELRNDSQLGVAGLLDVLRTGNVIMINPIGIGVLENPALNPFLPSICEYLFGEKLILPQIATWWCGQEAERKYVLEHLDLLIIKKINRSSDENIFICQKLSKYERDELKEKIIENPYLYIAQEQIEFSTTPVFVNDEIEARKNSLRIFSYKDNEHYHVMNGGLAKISAHKDAFIVSNHSGGGSKDLWILDNEKNSQNQSQAIVKNIQEINPISSLTTKRAENIFWLGRYLQRTIITARVLRLCLKYFISHIHTDDQITTQITSIISKTITHLTMTYPGFLSEEKILLIDEIKSVINDTNRIGTLSFTLSMLSGINLNIKNQLSNENRKVFDKLESSWFSSNQKKALNNRSQIEKLDNLLIYLTAYKELLNESIFHEQGVIFYKLGSNLELAMLLISKTRSLLVYQNDKTVENEILKFLLDSYESYHAYKSHYKTQLDIELVTKFLIFEQNYPKSLRSILNQIAFHLDEIQNEQNIRSHFDNSHQHLKTIFDLFKNCDVDNLLSINEESYVYENLDKLLNEITTALIEFSNEFSKNYFSHYYE
jgi:uncharacterized circularly permuted ATP-grasp superfamily protein/uncharacterized alpha-E superfamily protein